MCMTDVLMMFSLGGIFAVVGFMGMKFYEDRKSKKIVKSSNWYRKEGYQ